MKKLLILLFCLISLKSVSQTWYGTGTSNLQRTPTAKGWFYRNNMVAIGNVTWYTAPQLDSLLAIASTGWVPTTRLVSTTTPLQGGGNLGSNLSLSILQSSTSQGGFLSATDWNTFNGKQASGNYITALTGEATASGPGSSAVTLTNSAVIGKVLTGYTSDAGTVSPSDNILQAIQKLNGNTAAISAGAITGLTGDGTASGPGNVAFTLATVNSTQGSYGDASHVATITSNGKGLSTATGQTSIQIAESQVTSLTTDLGLRELLSNKTATQSSSVTTYPNWLGVTNYVATVGPQSTVANIMPEIAPATIPGSVYDMLPVVLISKTGKTFVFFKRGTGHAVGGDLYLTTSTDNKTFTTPTLILHSGSYNVNNISGIVTNTGRIGLFVTKQDTGTSLSTGIDCLYSDDEFATHTTVNVTGSVLNATGSIGIGASNKIMIPVYDDANSVAKVITSTDNLATFSSTVDINNIATHTVNETGIAYLSGTTWLALCRTAPVAGSLYQFLSTDDGATWAAIGSMDVGETSPTDIAPFLTTYNDINGRLMVEAFWSNRRSPGNISTATAAALDLINNGVSAWVNGSFKVIVTTTADGNSGYPTFAHFNNSQYGIMAYYYGTSSILTNIKFAVWPAAGTPDVVYGDFNITGDFYRNGVKTPTGGVINWPGAIYTTPTTATNVAGTLTFAPALATQSPNLVFASATAGTTTPSFRSLVTADLPALSTLTFGTHITGSSYNPATGGVTIATDAVTTNTANTLVTRGASGQFSMGALTATTAAFSGTNNFFTNNAATTAAKWLSIANTGGSALFGAESSTGGAILTGAGAYEVSIGNNNTTNLNFGVGGTRRAWLDNSGNFTTLGNLTATVPAYSSGSNLPVVYNSTNSRFETAAIAPIHGNSTTTGTATTVVTVTIGSTMANTTYNTTITPRDLVTAVNYYVSAQTTTTFDVTFVTGITGSISFDWSVTP